MDLRQPAYVYDIISIDDYNKVMKIMAFVRPGRLRPLGHNDPEWGGQNRYDKGPYQHRHQVISSIMQVDVAVFDSHGGVLLLKGKAPEEACSRTKACHAARL